MLIAGSISVEIKTVLRYILYTMPRPCSALDLRWRMVYQRLFYQRRYKEIASQLSVCPKTVYRTITFLNSGDVKPYRLGRPTGSASLFDHEESIYVQYWQSDSDGQIYFPMVQMDPSDKRIFGRRSIFPMENK